MTQRLPSDDLPKLPKRPGDAHKGTFGTVAVIGGCDDLSPHLLRMIGAPAISGLAALRAGAGLVKLVAPSSVLTAALTICPGATGIPMPQTDHAIEAHDATATVDQAIAQATVLAVGPGLGHSRAAQAATLRAIQQEDLPVVVDADGLNALAAIPEFKRDLRAAAVLTPHPGEFKRLCTGLGLTNNLNIDTSREQACEQLAQRLGCIVVLKGAGTVVSDGLRTWVCSAGHPCLATAGTGDVLTGLTAGLIAQFVPGHLSLFDAARTAVFCHARAGELWAERHKASAGLLVTELVDLLPEIIETRRR